MTNTSDSASELSGGGYQETGIQDTAGTPTTNEELRGAKEYAEMIVDTVREALLIMDLDLRVQSANKTFYEKFEVSPEETTGKLVYELGGGQWDIPELRTLLEEILPQNKVIDDYEVERDFKKIGHRVMLLNARQLNEHQLILLAIEDVTERKKTLRQLEDLNETLEERVQERTRQVQALASALTTAEQQERKRIADVLHDHIQQMLFGMEMTLRRVRKRTETFPDTEAKKEQQAFLDQLEKTLSQTLQDTRSLSVELSPPVTSEEDMRGAFDWLAGYMRDRHDLSVDVALEEDFLVPSEELRTILFQGARELLFNVVKHTGMHRVHLEGRKEGEMLVIGIHDDGKGFDKTILEEQTGGRGLSSMQDRLELMEGQIQIETAPGEGTSATIYVPEGAAQAT